MKSKSKDFSIIDKELTVKGTVSTKGKLVVKGVVKGTLTGDVVIISEEGAVYADTKVTSMTIGGIFKGEISASDELIILPTGSCSGKVVCKNFAVEPGGILNAQVTCLTNQEVNSAKESSQPEKKSAVPTATTEAQKISLNSGGDMSKEKK